MKQATRFMRLALLLVLVGALALAGCGGDDGVSQSVVDQLELDREADRLAAIQTAMTAIAAAATPEAAQALYDAIKDRATAEEDVELLAAVQARTTALADAAAQAERDRLAALEEERRRAEEAERMKAEQAERERMAAIDGAEAAIAAAATVEEAQAAYDAVKAQATAEEGDRLMQAVEARGLALAAIARTVSQTEALMTAGTALGEIDLEDLDTAEKIAAANMAVTALKSALDAAMDVSNADKGMYLNQLTAAETAVMTAQMALDHMMQAMALNTAVTALTAITPTDLDTQAKVDAANMAIAAVRAALEGATALMDNEKVAANQALALYNQAVMSAQMSLDMGTAADQMAVLDDAHDALGAIDLMALSTQEDIDAAQMAVDALQAALDAASRLDADDTADAMTDLGLAKRRVAAAQTMLDDNIEAQTMALTEAGTALGALDLGDLSTQEAVNAAKAAVYALKMALDGATHVSEADKAMYMSQLTMAETSVMTAQSVIHHATQTMMLTDAREALDDIDLSSLSTREQIDAAKDAIADLQMALDAATELTATETAEAMAELRVANRNVDRAEDKLEFRTQTMALTDAVNTLGDIDLDLDALMTQDAIDAAQRAIDALQMALDDAPDADNDQRLNANLDLRSAQRAVDRAQTTLDGNIDAQHMALHEAATALDDLNLSEIADDIDADADLDTQAKIDAAKAALAKLKEALDGATHLSDAEKAGYQGHHDVVYEAVKTADTGMDRMQRMASQRSAISTAVTNASAAVAGVTNTSTDSEVGSADAALAALKKAIDDAVDLDANDVNVAMARGTLTALEGQLETKKTARTEYVEKKDEEDKKAATKAGRELGKAMHAALAGNATADTTARDNATATLSATGLEVDAAAGAGSLADATDPASMTLKAVEGSATALGSWNGMDYVETTGTGASKYNTDEARVYTNQGPGERKPFSGTGGVYTLVSGQTGNTAVNNGYLGSDATTVLDVSAAATDLAKVRAPAFTHSGTETHQRRTESDAVYVTGTYDGAPGRFRCASDACSSTNDGSGAPNILTGVWTFKPNSGAMVHQPDAHYLYYGWWVSKDKDGNPTAASAFMGRFGTESDVSTDGLDPGWAGAYSSLSGVEALTGSATYEGHAAGKFAINDVLDGTGNGGHFTADAMLEATFSAADDDDVGITGIIDNFRLNDGSDDPGWSVSLHRAGFGDAGAITAPAENGTAIMGTTWSRNGNKAPASGTWSGMMYDEAVTGDADDGSNLPTTVTGTFYSELSTIGRIVGAFGADKQ